ncbi:MAG: flagellar basal body-associated FliL family protein [Bdellovibrionales bacterium]|nr:flagellar basal body-associated FliL family protein [Bdellovibrionales bacterium]
MKVGTIMSEEEDKKVENTENPDENLEEVEDEEDDEDLAEALGEKSDGDLSAEDIDKVINEEDPLFQDELSKINEDDFKNLIIDDKQASGEVDDSDKKGPSLWKSFLKNLPKEKKLNLYVAGGVVALFLPIITLLLMGKLIPRFDIPYIVSLEELTDEIYTYPTDGVEVPLFDDYRSNAITYALPKTMINLRREGSNPSYGEFEFFLNLREKELEAVIKSKQSEIMDLVQRTLEQITWSELQNPTGKEKVKKVIRHRVNDFLQGNIVLGVYYRSILLQK